jgi:hypothetical protein
MSKIQDFLEVEIMVTKNRLNSDVNDYFNGEHVGHKIGTRLWEKHIVFCEHLLELIAKESDGNNNEQTNIR